MKNMKMKRLLVILLVMIMSLAMLGTFVGCGTKDKETDKKTESRQDRDEDDEDDDDEDDEDDDEADATATPEPTPEPTPTPEPEKMPTAEELIELNKGKFVDNMKVEMTFAYEGSDGTEEVAMAIDASNSRYENVEYQNNEITISMMGYSETVHEEVYYVDDEASGMRTEYYYDTDAEKWVKSEYAYVEADEDEDTDSTPLESLTNIEVTTDGAFYYVTGELDSSMVSDLTAGMGTEGANVVTATCEFKFDAKSKEVMGADIVIKFAIEETDGITLNVDDFVIKVEMLTEPIVIPEEVLAAESDIDVDIDWEVIPGDDEQTDGTKTSELPESWGGWYDEYNSKSGTFMMWDDENAEDIPITVYEKENWYFDNQFTYSLYLVVDEPSISDYGPAYEVEYRDSDTKTANPERAAAMLLTKDYSETKTLEDIVPIICNEKQCFYLDITEYDYVRTFVVFQDIGFDTFVEIVIMTPDLVSEPLDIIQKFMLDITQNSGQEV